MKIPAVERLALPLFPSKEEGKTVLFFTGWGMDKQTVPFELPNDCRLHIVHSYHLQSLEQLEEELFSFSSNGGWGEVVVVAWSWGVMMAEKLLPSLNLPVREAIAINGTPKAVDDCYGIPRRVATLTLRAMNAVARENFYLRMCGDQAVFEQFNRCRPQRDIDDVTAELQFLIEARRADPPQLPWKRAVVGGCDLIIPPSNQLNYWNGYGKGIEIIQKEMPHLPLTLRHGREPNTHYI